MPMVASRSWIYKPRSLQVKRGGMERTRYFMWLYGGCSYLPISQAGGGANFKSGWHCPSDSRVVADSFHQHGCAWCINAYFQENVYIYVPRRHYGHFSLSVNAALPLSN